VSWPWPLEQCKQIVVIEGGLLLDGRFAVT